MSAATLETSTQRIAFRGSPVDDGAQSDALAELLTADGKTLDEEARDSAKALTIIVFTSAAAMLSTAAGAAFLLLG